jgi:hypothetical protein
MMKETTMTPRSKYDRQACWCARPDCAAEIYEDDSYIHEDGNFYHLNCWWVENKLPPTFRKTTGLKLPADDWTKQKPIEKDDSPF